MPRDLETREFLMTNDQILMTKEFPMSKRRCQSGRGLPHSKTRRILFADGSAGRFALPKKDGSAGRFALPKKDGSAGRFALPNRFGGSDATL